MSRRRRALLATLGKNAFFAQPFGEMEQCPQRWRAAFTAAGDFRSYSWDHGLDPRDVLGHRKSPPTIPSFLALTHIGLRVAASSTRFPQCYGRFYHNHTTPPHNAQDRFVWGLDGNHATIATRRFNNPHPPRLVSGKDKPADRQPPTGHHRNHMRPSDKQNTGPAYTGVRQQRRIRGPPPYAIC